MRRNRVIVTGGCGYIGSHTVIQLIRSGYEVVSIDNLSRATSESINRIERVTGIRIKNYEFDLTNPQLVDQFFDQNDEIEGIIHFAAFKSVPESVKFPALYYTNNIFSLCNVLSNCIRHKIKKIVYSSSCSIYGDIKKLPVCEETELSEPKSPYASTKIMGERMLKDVCISHGIRGLALRYFNPVGAHSSGKIGETPFRKPDNLLPIITQTAIGKRECLEVFGGNLKTIDGSCVRDYVHVMDIADAHVLALEYMSNMKMDFDVINLGSGKGISVFEAINAFESISGLKLKYKIGPPREGDVVEIYSDVSKAKKILGWIPKYDISHMMSSAWAWEQELSRQTKFESTANSLRLP